MAVSEFENFTNLLHFAFLELLTFSESNTKKKFVMVLSNVIFVPV